MDNIIPDHPQTLDIEHSVWERFFMAAPLVLVGPLELDGGFDLAPKHMAMPMSRQNDYGCVCAPHHSICQNLQRGGVYRQFSVSAADRIDQSAADARAEDGSKLALPTFPTSRDRWRPGEGCLSPYRVWAASNRR